MERCSWDGHLLFEIDVAALGQMKHGHHDGNFHERSGVRPLVSVHKEPVARGEILERYAVGAGPVYDLLADRCLELLEGLHRFRSMQERCDSQW